MKKRNEMRKYTEIVSDRRDFLELPDVCRWILEPQIVFSDSAYCIILIKGELFGSAYHFLKSHPNVLGMKEVSDAGNGAEH